MDRADVIDLHCRVLHTFYQQPEQSEEKEMIKKVIYIKIYIKTLRPVPGGCVEGQSAVEIRCLLDQTMH